MQRKNLLQMAMGILFVSTMVLSGCGLKKDKTPPPAQIYFTDSVPHEGSHTVNGFIGINEMDNEYDSLGPVVEVKQGKMTLKLPETVSEENLPAADMFMGTATGGLKTGILYLAVETVFGQALHLKKGIDGDRALFEYANKDGTFTLDGRDKNYKKGWNVFYDGGSISAGDLQKLYDMGYKWYLDQL
jgi:hypothetical protein